MNNIILLGAPGAGKGTQAANLTEKLNVPHISTGDIFRANIKNETELGKLAKKYIDEGGLVPDDVTVGIVRTRLMEDDCKNGFLLDGFPRTINQAQQLDEVLKELNTEISYVINIKADDDLIIKRLSGRRICKQCNEGYHIVTIPPKKEGICDKCGCELIIRDDDKPETVKKRLETYHNQTKPLIGYYDKKDKLIEVDGQQSIKDTTKSILNALNIK